MAVNEQDLDLMEQWLDGELPEPQAEALRAKISGEPQLAQVLDRLRGERKMRAEIFAALEPTHHDVDALINNVRSAVRKEEVWAWRMRMLRQVSGVAAAIAMVFTAGWISRSKLHVGALDQQITQQINVPSRIIVTQVVPAPSGSQGPGGPPEATRVSTNPNTAAGTFGGTVRLDMVDPNGFTRIRPTFKVLVSDPWGRGVVIREFENVTDANRFAADISNFLDSRPSVPSQPVPQSIPVDTPPR